MIKRTAPYTVIYVFFSFILISGIVNFMINVKEFEKIDERGCWTETSYYLVSFGGEYGIEISPYRETPICYAPPFDPSPSHMIETMNDKYENMFWGLYFLVVLNGLFIWHLVSQYHLKRPHEAMKPFTTSVNHEEKSE